MVERVRADTLGFRLPLFGREVFAARRREAGDLVAGVGLDALLVTVPENIYYLVGLDHFGYFAFHALVLPAEGEAVLIARRMEHVTIARDVPDLDFAGYGDEDDIAFHCVDVVRCTVGTRTRIGMEQSSLYFPPKVWSTIVASMPESEFVDASDLLTRPRLVQRPEEMAVTRQAAEVSDAMMSAAIDAAGVGVTEREVATAAVAAMMAAGGEPPAFWPFVRATSRLNEDHTTWTDYPMKAGDALFLELSGSIGRYHAPMGRLVFIGEAPPGSAEVAGVCLGAFEAARSTAASGAVAGDVYEAWQGVVDDAGLAHYRRHHCGYATGIGFPPSWSGNGVPKALRPGGTDTLVEGMVFHLMSWMMGTGQGDYFVSDPVVITPSGAERLSTTPQGMRVV